MGRKRKGRKGEEGLGRKRKAKLFERREKGKRKGRSRDEFVITYEPACCLLHDDDD